MREKNERGRGQIRWGVICLGGGFILLAAAGALRVEGWAIWAGLGLLTLGLALEVWGRRARERALREEIEECRQEMEAREQEYSLSLAQAQARAGQEIETFRSAMSHSLRMPIAIIQGYADLLAGDVATDPEVRRDYLEKIVKRTQDMTEVLGRKIAHGGLKRSNLSFAQVDLLGLVRQTAEDMRTAAGEREVRIQVISTMERLEVQADEYLIRRVLFNLIENALKYMGRPGTVSIRVQKDGAYALLSLQDDGFGLDEEEAEHIFELKYQGSNRAGGQGYGLYMVKQVVEAHGGTVSARSRVGKGLGIHIALPLTQGRQEEQEEQEECREACIGR